MASSNSRIGRACGDKAKFEDVEGSVRQSSKRFGKQCSEANARTENWPDSNIHEDTLADSQVNEGADNYHRKYSETDPWELACDLMATPFSAGAPQMLTPNPSPSPEPPQFLEPVVTVANWSDFEPSKMSETQSKTSSPLQRRLDSIRSTCAPPYKPQGEHSRAISETRGRDTHISNLEQGKGAKVTTLTNNCASCRTIKIKVIRTPLLVDGPHY